MPGVLLGSPSAQPGAARPARPVQRAWLSRDYGEAPSPIQAASWLDTKRLFMDMRPNLRRIYTIVQDVATFGPMVAPLGFELLPGDPIQFDGVPYYAAQNDFGPSSIDGWLSELVAAELQIEEDAILDLVQHQLVLDGRRVDLTKLEFDVISYLHQRKGTVVERSDLLRDVWGYEYAGGSNVIEANVRSLRRKLGDRCRIDRDGPGHGLPLRGRRLASRPTAWRGSNLRPEPAAVVERDQRLLAADLELLDRPGVAVRVAEAEERAAVALVEDHDLAGLDAPVEQLLAGGLRRRRRRAAARASSPAPSRAATAGRR